MTTEPKNKSTLVLNASWQPINKVHWVKAFVKVFQGRARTLEYHEDTFLTSSDEHFIPAVILCTEYSRTPRGRTLYSKRLVLQRDSFLCQYCRKKLNSSSATIDHIHPRSKGGKSTFINCVCSCSPCNTHKANKTLEEARMRLIRPPRKPYIHPLKGRIGTPEPEWVDYLQGVV